MPHDYTDCAFIILCHSVKLVLCPTCFTAAAVERKWKAGGQSNGEMFLCDHVLVENLFLDGETAATVERGRGKDKKIY